MVEQIGNSADPVALIVRLGTVGPVPVHVGQNIMSLVGESSHGPAMIAMDLTSGKEVLDYYVSGPLAEGGRLAFGQGLQAGYFVRVLGQGYAAAKIQTTDGLGSPSNSGLFEAVNDGIVGNSAYAVVETGTFHAHDVEYFPGENDEGPYYLAQCDLIGPYPPTGNDKNWVRVDGVDFECVYSAPELVATKVYVDCTNGTLTFFEGEGPLESQEIECNIAHHTRKVTVYDGELRPDAHDNLADKNAIAAAFQNSPTLRYEPDLVFTHLPAIGTYRLVGGLDGAAITEDDWDDAIYVLRDKLEQTLTGTTTLALTTNMVEQDDSYDLIPLLDAHLSEMEQNWMPCVGFIGMKQNEDPAVAMQVCSNYGNRNLCIVANPWGGERQEPRTNGWIARAAREASLPLGDSAAERSTLNTIRSMNGLLNIYRKETVTALHNRRLEVLIKDDAGLFPYYARGCGWDWQFVELVDNRTVNYILTMLYYVSKRFFFKKNTPSVRASFKMSIAQELNNLLEQEVIMKYTLDVKGPGDRGYVYTDTGRVNVHLQVENVGHIHQIFVNYDVGIIPEGANVITLNTLLTQREGGI